MIDIKTPETESELSAVREMMRAFVRWHLERQRDNSELIDKYFDGDAFEREIESLPGIYSAPRGCLISASFHDRPAGCVAFKRLDEAACEMKRMFVHPGFQGEGIGRALGAEILARARTAGYTRMYLDTSVKQVEAIALYRSMGFRDTDAWYEIPEDLHGWLIFMRLDL